MFYRVKNYKLIDNKGYLLAFAIKRLIIYICKVIDKLFS